jgi:hypothetical protein|tara:strand:- start:1229 stop:1705 length:477 start_codon:yes stop_codon:yes gene_type:complete
MTLKELQNMIKEEFDAYMGEAEDDVDVSVSDNDVDAEMGDMGDNIDDSEEDVLRKIFDMLKTHFEGDEDAEDMDDMGDMGDEEGDDMGEMPMEGAEDELEENATTDAKFQKTGMAPMSKGSAGANAGYGNVGGKGSTGYDAGSKALQERFQKLANIIK